MANHTTGAQRHNARQDKIWELAMALKRRADDEKTIAERKWQQRKLAPVAQKQCDHGLFSDDAKQTDLLDLTRAQGR